MVHKIAVLKDELFEIITKPHHGLLDVHGIMREAMQCASGWGVATDTGDRVGIY